MTEAEPANRPCIFCDIAAGTSPAKFYYQGERIVAFANIHPLTPFHALVISRQHIPSLALAEDRALLGEMLLISARLAQEAEYEESGYRVATNVGPDSGQEVPHLHLHVMAGRKLGPAG